jgi:hypothetical protein
MTYPKSHLKLGGGILTPFAKPLLLPSLVPFRLEFYVAFWSMCRQAGCSPGALGTYEETNSYKDLFRRKFEED